MTHLFVNVNVDDVIDDLLSKNKTKSCFSLRDDLSVCLYYDSQEWDSEPHVSDEYSQLFISGWFNINGRKNDISLLKNLLDTTFNSVDKGWGAEINHYISSGVFTGFYIRNNNFYIFTDPFSLSSCYYNVNGDLMVSPFPENIGNEVDDKLAKILDSQGHLFGKYTAFKDVYRLMPNDILCVEKDTYIDGSQIRLKETKGNLDFVSDKIKETTQLWDRTQLSIALSAGFDSRLIASTCTPEYSYTWGPESSFDQQVGKKVADYIKSNHIQFRFKDHQISDVDQLICQKIFNGVVTKYNTQLFTNYKFVSSVTNNSHIALDGYLGDVLQRGVYLYPSNKFGELAKLFPSTMYSYDDCWSILRSRYASVPDELFSLIYDDFITRTENVDGINGIGKITYYEFLFGRGVRYITTGAIVMNSFFKTVVPAFADMDIFSLLIRQNQKDVLSYKVFEDIWSNIDNFYCTLRSEGMYTPCTPRLIIPYLNFIGRLVTNKIPYFYNYTRE